MPLFRKAAVETRAVEVVERRDPTAATKSLRYLSPGRAVPPDWDAAQAFGIANNTVLSCINRVSKYLTRCPFRAGADPDKLDDYDVKAPLAKLLGPPPGGPNVETPARRLWAWTIGQRMMAGRFAWEIETAAGSDTPVALWALPASGLTPIPAASGVHYFTGFEYGRAGDRRRLTRDSVVYDWISHPADWRQVDPPLRAAHLDTMIAVMQSHYDYAFLKNDARPPAIVVTEQFEDSDSFDAFKRQWNSDYSGPDNAGRIAFLEATGSSDQGVKGAVDVTVLGISPKDAQAAQRYKERLEQIAIAFGVPWSILDASARTFSNASQEWENFVKGTLEPLAADLADAINIQLAPRLGNLVGWFDLRPLGVKKHVDPITAQVGAPAMVQAQLMTINEARADYELVAMPDGDRMMTADEIAALRGAAGPADVVRALEAIDTRMTTLEVREVPVPVPTASAPPALAPVDHEARRAKLWNTTSGKVRNLERQWERALRKLFARQSRSVVARLEGKRGRTLAGRTDVRALGDEVFDPAHWILETTDDVEALYEAVTAAGGARVSDLFGLAFDIEAPFAQEFIQAQANRLAGQVTETTYSAIKSTLADGVAAGESIPELATRVRSVFDIASQSRATLIARTEVVGAFNGAATLTATQYGADVVAGKEWIATHDSRVREEHAALDGEIVDVTDAFTNGLAYPGEPNCRCTVAFLTPEEMASRGGGRARMVEGRMALVALAAWDPASGSTATFRAALSVAA